MRLFKIKIIRAVVLTITFLLACSPIREVYKATQYIPPIYGKGYVLKNKAYLVYPTLFKIFVGKLTRNNLKIISSVKFPKVSCEPILPVLSVDNYIRYYMRFNFQEKTTEIYELNLKNKELKLLVSLPRYIKTGKDSINTMSFSFCSSPFLLKDNVLVVPSDIDPKKDYIFISLVKLAHNNYKLIDTIRFNLPEEYHKKNFFLTHLLLCIGGYSKEEQSFMVGFAVNDTIIKISNIEYNKDTTKIKSYKREVIKVPSKYLLTIKEFDNNYNDNLEIANYLGEAGRYGSIHYNPYNKKYYRINLLPTKDVGINIKKQTIEVQIFDNKTIRNYKLKGENIFPRILGFYKDNVYFESSVKDTSGTEALTIKVFEF